MARPTTFWKTVTIIGTLGLLPMLAASAHGGWHIFNTGDGLIHNNVRSIVEDHAENLWFATQEGVSRYDGVTWKSFTTADGLPSNNVHCALAARDGGVWFGFQEGGVALFLHDTLQAITPPDAITQYPVWKVTQGQGNRIWFASLGGGAFWYENGSWGQINAGMPSNYLLAVLEDHNGDLWVGANAVGVGYRHGNTWTRYTTSDGLAANAVLHIMEDEHHSLWFATNEGVSRRDSTGAWRTYTTADGLAGNNVYSMLEDRRGALWFGTRFQGVSRFDGRSWERYPVLDGLGAWSITQDRSGNLWFGSVGGATRYDGSEMKTFPELSTQAVETVYSMMEDSKGAIWFGTNGPARRFDGTSWTEFSVASTGGHLIGDFVGNVLEDRAGNYWFQSYGSGVTRWDGHTTWTRFSTKDGLVSNQVRMALEDPSGNIWVGSLGGVNIFDGATWRVLTVADGLAGNDTFWMTRARDGAMWISSRDGGVSRFGSDSTWTTYTTADGLASNRIWGVFQDRSDAMWFGTTSAGASRFYGSSWTTYTSKDGLVNDAVLNISQDRAGNLWFSQDLSGGASRWDGINWRNLSATDGLPTASVTQVLEDHRGDLWIATFNGIARYRPDIVPPRTVVSQRPPSLSASRRQSASFSALGESDRIEYSYRLDRGGWSPWSATNSWTGVDLLDGSHTLEARARDYWVNVDETPEVATFEIDATPPIAVLASPPFGFPVKGQVEIRGDAADARFQMFRVHLRDAGTLTWDPGSVTELGSSQSPVHNGLLATWDTSPYPDGIYDLRLSVMDSLGLTGFAQVTVVVDNKAPYADQTAPTTIRAESGGDVYTTNGEVHLYFPPHAFGEDALVTITPVEASQESGPAKAVLLDPGFEISWNGGALRKAARLELTFGSEAAPANAEASPAVYREETGGTWERLGGTVDRVTGRLSLAISEPGEYALFADEGVPGGAETMSGLALTPRVFSPSGGFADRQVGISFSLGRAGPVTVKVYTRSGRLVREVAAGVPLGAGENLITWDGRDRDGTFVSDDLYFVTVEAFGETAKRTLAVVK